MNTLTQVFLVGTSHAYQFGKGVTFGDTTCTPEIAAQFRQYVIEVHDHYEIRAIAEEMSVEALAEMECTVSLLKFLADDVSVPHRYCDPIRRERANLGIRDENFIRAIGHISSKSPDEIEVEVLSERRKREPIWLAQLQSLNTWPVLFICGAWHIPSFTALLQQAGLPSVTLASDWGPNPSINTDAGD